MGKYDGRGKTKFISKEEALKAIENTLSNRAAAVFCGVSYRTWKKYAKGYVDENGVSLFDKHFNQKGAGIPKKVSTKKSSKLHVKDILAGNFPIDSLKPSQVVGALVDEGYLEGCCSYCGFNKRREIDGKLPLLINFLDKNKRNYNITNIELVCYNCYFLNFGNFISAKEKQHLERPKKSKINKIDWSLEIEEEEVDRWNEVSDISLDDLSDYNF